MKAKPKDIDFTDKTKENDTSIDDLLAIEMNKRKAELELYQTSDKSAKEVEDWIHDSTPHMLNTTNDVSKITITDQDVNLKSNFITKNREKQKINKKVSFQTPHTEHETNTPINKVTDVDIVSTETKANAFTSKLKSILKPKRTTVTESTQNIEGNASGEITNLTAKIVILESKINTMADKLDSIYTYILSNHKTEHPHQ